MLRVLASSEKPFMTSRRTLRSPGCQQLGKQSIYGRLSLFRQGDTHEEDQPAISGTLRGTVGWADGGAGSGRVPTSTQTNEDQHENALSVRSCLYASTCMYARSAQRLYRRHRTCRCGWNRWRRRHRPDSGGSLHRINQRCDTRRGRRPCRRCVGCG